MCPWHWFWYWRYRMKQSSQKLLPAWGLYPSVWRKIYTYTSYRHIYTHILHKNIYADGERSTKNIKQVIRQCHCVWGRGLLHYPESFGIRVRHEGWLRLHGPANVKTGKGKVKWSWRVSWQSGGVAGSIWLRGARGGQQQGVGSLPGASRVLRLPPHSCQWWLEQRVGCLM